ncbi:MAG: TonB-dependent receptor [Bacteroidota bacterium]
MKKLPILLLLFCCWCAFSASAQTLISGTITDNTGEAVGFANVYLDDIFDGSPTDENGRFEFTTQATGKALLIVSSLGYEAFNQELDLSTDQRDLQLTLNTAGEELTAVVITAGAFEASDEKKGTILKPLDIVQNAGAEGDVYSALATLPGVSAIGDETGIFVRGGEASETRTIINGTLVQRPFFSQVPNVPSRGRFDPFLFKGTLFTTGGYSAEYGQALSSVLILDTQDIPAETTSSVGVTMAGVDLSHTHVWNKKTALIGSIGYSNLWPLFNIVPQNVEWDTPPNGLGGSAAFRHKTEKGIFKSYFQFQDGTIGINFPNLDAPDVKQPFENNNQNWYWNNSYTGFIGKDWQLYAGASFGYDKDDYTFNGNRFGTNGSLTQSKLTLAKEFTNSFGLKFGGEVHYSDESSYYNNFEQQIEEVYTGIFTEAELRMGPRLAIRVGARGEYSDLLAQANIAPRASLAFKTGAKSQVSLAYGSFFQRPQSEFLQEITDLDFEQSTHYIANYQWLTDDYTFRVEAYRKDYDNLLRNNATTFFDNTGYGYAQGIDVFWRDRRTLPQLDYWVSYSYIDSKRDFRDYPGLATPPFITDHTVNVVANYNFNRQWRVGSSYTFATGRTYRNPNNPEFLGDRTMHYHNFNCNASYLTSIFGNFSVIYFSLRNPLGFKQVFNYRYSSDGSQRSAVGPASDWSFFAGVYISFQ